MTHDDQTRPTTVTTTPPPHHHHAHHANPNQPIRIQPKPYQNPKVQPSKSKKQKSIAKNQNQNPIKIGIQPKPHQNPMSKSF